MIKSACLKIHTVTLHTKHSIILDRCFGFQNAITEPFQDFSVNVYVFIILVAGISGTLD